MKLLDYWHPVIGSKELKTGKPTGVKICNQELALFRANASQLGAVEDKCVHRRMRLSVGKVVNECLQCPYHGWTFNCQGEGESPGTPKLHATTTSYDVREFHGAIWVKNRGPEQPLAELDPGGLYYIGLVRHDFPAPIELVIDAFSEIEHTGFVHSTFGLDPKQNHLCEVNYEFDDSSVTVRNRGPAKPPGNWLIRQLLAYKPWMWFNSHFTFRFDPPRVVIDHWWNDPNDPKREAMIRYRVHQFFVPMMEGHSQLVTFTFAKTRYPLPQGGGVGWVRNWILKEVSDEIVADIWLCENLVEKSPSIEGLKLSRFDRTMGLNRERLGRIYYGSP
jgi:phenylpropionate dioxygenase-like ring-hydroxylating dioxygenase large terminal subunit